MKTYRAIILICLLFIPAIVNAQSAETGQALCYQIEKGVNALVDYTHTSCLPTAGKFQGSYSFIIVSSQPVFSVEASKKGWLLVSVAVAGDAFNNNQSITVDEIMFSDAQLMKDRTSYIFPATLAKSLQRRIKADKITLDTMYAQIKRNLVRRVIPKK